MFSGLPECKLQRFWIQRRRKLPQRGLRVSKSPGKLADPFLSLSPFRCELVPFTLEPGDHRPLRGSAGAALPLSACDQAQPGRCLCVHRLPPVLTAGVAILPRASREHWSELAISWLLPQAGPCGLYGLQPVLPGGARGHWLRQAKHRGRSAPQAAGPASRGAALAISWAT